MLNTTDIALVRAQFRAIAPQADEFAEAFYARLFQLVPQARGLFPQDLADQRRKLVAALAHVVGRLDALDTVGADLAAMGARHAGYGASPEGYVAVGVALLDTLESTLGASFDDRARTVWSTAYAVIAGAMQAGAEAQNRAAA